MEILDALNAHLGTQFSMNNTWEVSKIGIFKMYTKLCSAYTNENFESASCTKDVFREEAALPEDGNASLNPDDEWPSDDSADENYDPGRGENSSSDDGAGTDDSASDYEYLSNGSIGSDDSTDAEILSGRRQRRDVDYRKLYDVSIQNFIVYVDSKKQKRFPFSHQCKKVSLKISIR